MSYILILDAKGLYENLELLKILNFPDIKYRRNDNSLKYQLIENMFSESCSRRAVYTAAFGRKMAKLGLHTFILVRFLCYMYLSPFLPYRKTGKPKT